MSHELIKLGEQRAKELGLTNYDLGYQGLRYYPADDIHKLLAEGKMRYSFGGMCEWNAESEMELRAGAKDEPLISGLIIGIRPIHKETREEKALSLLKEMVGFGMTTKSESFYERAKQLLSERET